MSIHELDDFIDSPDFLHSLAFKVCSPNDVPASLATDSFRPSDMSIVPCRMKKLAGLRMGYDNDLTTRAVSVPQK